MADYTLTLPGLRQQSLCLVGAALVLLSLYSHATPPPPQPENLSGSVTVSGMLLSAPCELAAESHEQTLTLGAVSVAALGQPGNVTVPVTLNIVLEDCPGALHWLNDHQQIRGNSLLPGQSAIKMTLLGDAEPGHAGLFRLHGSASGVALRLEGPDGETLAPALASRPLPLYPGRNVLSLKAQLWRTDRPLHTGEVQAVVQINMEYE